MNEKSSNEKHRDQYFVEKNKYQQPKLDDPYEDPAYVIWDSGTIEKFTCVKNAKEEISLSLSRGLHGVLIEDVVDAIIHMAQRHGISLYHVLSGPELTVAGNTPYIWRTDRDEAGKGSVWLYRAIDQEAYWLTNYPYHDLDQTDLDGLPNLLMSRLTKSGSLECELEQARLTVDKLKRELEELNNKGKN